MRARPARPLPAPRGVAAEMTIAIVNYRAGELLLDTLAALAAAPPDCTWHAVVVDNSPGDGTAERVRACFPWVEILTNPCNVGFARACNQVLRGCRSPYVLLLNPDTAVQPGALARLRAVLAAHPRVAAVGPRLVYPDGRYQHSAFKQPGLAQAFFGFFELVPLDHPWNGRYPPPTSDAPRAVEHLLGACLMLRQEALADVGLLDERFFIYFEETDWCARARRRGWELWHVPGAVVVHHSGGTTRAVAEAMSLQFHRSQALFYRKHYGLGGYLALKAIAVAGVGWRLARSLVATARRRIPPSLLAERLPVYWGIVRA
ncbi:MAG TPA: glycosyltransferase [Chloroflexota bacterium]|nr:glycosyltransferase [Chloroflexota bacterium]